MTGCFVAVVGPSGVGKDSVIAEARDRLAGDPRFLFVRRVVTRAEGGNEDHDTLDPAVFPAAEKAGAFVLSWGAHGLFYGIPERTRAEVAAGRIAIANLSRGALPRLATAFPRVSVVALTAPPEVLARRLAARGRESASAIADRLARTGAPLVGADVTVIENAGPLGDAVDHFVAHLTALAMQTEAGGVPSRPSRAVT